MKAAPKSQREMYYDAERRSAEINKTFLEMLPTMRRRDLKKLIEKRPALWGRFAGYLTSGHVFIDDEPTKTRHHATKKPQNNETPAWDFTIHSGQYRVRVVPEGRGYRAKLISVGIGTIMEPHGNSPTEALMSLARELYDTESVFERKLAKDIVRHTALPIVLESPARSAGRRSHSTKKQSDEVSVGDEVYAVSGGRRHGPGIVEEIYDDGTMRVDFTRQFAGRLRVRPQDLIYVPPK